MTVTTLAFAPSSCSSLMSRATPGARCKMPCAPSWATAAFTTCAGAGALTIPTWSSWDWCILPTRTLTTSPVTKPSGLMPHGCYALPSRKSVPWCCKGCLRPCARACALPHATWTGPSWTNCAHSALPTCASPGASPKMNAPCQPNGSSPRARQKTTGSMAVGRQLKTIWSLAPAARAWAVSYARAALGAAAILITKRSTTKPTRTSSARC